MTRRIAAGTLAALAITALSGTDQPPRPPPSATGAVLIPPVEYTRTPFGVRADRGSPRSELIHVEPVSVTVEAPTTTSTTAAPVQVRARAVRRPPVTVPFRPAPPTTVAAVVTSPGGLPAGLLCIRHRESGDNYAENTGNGYTGAYQYDAQTWAGYGGYRLASTAPPSVQDAKALAGYNAGPASRHRLWPQTSRACGV